MAFFSIKLYTASTSDAALMKHFEFSKQSRPADFAALIGSQVAGDAEQPRAQGTRGVEALQRAVGADEGLLRDVFGFIGVAQKQVGQTEDRRLVFAHQGLPRGPVAAAREGDQVRLAQAVILSGEALSPVIHHPAQEVPN